MKENIFDIISDCALNEKDELELKNYIEKKNVIFLSTPFSRPIHLVSMRVSLHLLVPIVFLYGLPLLIAKC